MSRRALWSPQARSAAPAAGEPTVASPAQGAPGGVLSPLRGRSELDLGGKLSRLADLLVEAGGIVRELSQVQLAEVRETRDRTCVEATPKTSVLLTAEDLAERLQVDARTIRRWRRNGTIPKGMEIAGVLRWRPEEIEVWVAQGGPR